MAKATVTMPDDFIQKCASLGSRTDEVMGEVLKAGGEVVLDAVKKQLSAVIGSGTKYESRSTGELVSSLGLSPPKVNRNGDHDIKIGFAEPRRNGESNAKIASVIENGKHGQVAKPFLKPAKSASKKACIEAMQAKLESEVNGL